MAATKDSPLDARTHPIPAAESNSGKIQVYGILISLFSATGTKEPPQQRSQPIRVQRKNKPLE
jgi:hypothetical protein